MPTLDIYIKDLEALSKKKFSAAQLEDAVLQAKGEIEGIKNGKAKVDIKDTNRPDLWSVEGIARELRGFYGIESGLPKFNVKKSGIVAKVDPKLKGIRPRGAYAVAKNIKITDELLEQLIQMQEKVCETFGRKRREVAIGIFDADKVAGNVRYYAAEPKTEFYPLGYKAKMSLSEILTDHPKGKEYGKLLKGMKNYPLLVDSDNEVLSMPPIINSEHSGKVTMKTKNLFLDVTGYNQETIDSALEILCAALSDRGATIESVRVDYGKEKIDTPRFNERKINVPIELVEKLFGEKLNEKQMLKLLKLKRMNAVKKGKNLVVSYPSYRLDVLHPVDIVEDMLIASDFNKIEPEKIKIAATGSELPKVKFIEAVREVCVGMGLLEVLTFTMTSKEKQQEKMLLKEQKFVEISNPVSVEYTVIRKSIIPELLSFLSKNKHCEFPQKIFEIGKTVSLDSKSETGVREPDTLCILLSGKGENFTSIKAHLDALSKAMAWKSEVREIAHESFKPGRCALVQGSVRGVLGELDKKVMKQFDLEMPTVVLEIEF